MVARLVAHSGRLAHRVTATQILRSGLMPLQRLTAAPEDRRTARKGRWGCGSCQYVDVGDLNTAEAGSGGAAGGASGYLPMRIIGAHDGGLQAAAGSKRNRVERACERRAVAGFECTCAVWV